MCSAASAAAAQRVSGQAGLRAGGCVAAAAAVEPSLGVRAALRALLLLGETPTVCSAVQEWWRRKRKGHEEFERRGSAKTYRLLGKTKREDAAKLGVT